MPLSEQSHTERLRKQGKKLARANKRCQGTRNDKGQFYKCLKREAKNIFHPKREGN